MSNTSDNIIGFHHPGIVVPDLDRAIDFYTKFLGYELISESSWDGNAAGFNQVVGLERSAARLCMLRGGNAYLELFEYSSPQATVDPGELGANEPGIRHIAICVKDVQLALDFCVELGGSKMNEPFGVPGGATAVYCRDPFGNLMELVAPAGRFPPPILP